MKYPNVTAIITMPHELYAYLRDTSMERALKSTDPVEKAELHRRLMELENLFHNAEYEIVAKVS